MNYTAKASKCEHTLAWAFSLPCLVDRSYIISFLGGVSDWGDCPTLFACMGLCDCCVSLADEFELQK